MEARKKAKTRGREHSRGQNQEPGPTSPVLSEGQASRLPGDSHLFSTLSSHAVWSLHGEPWAVWGQRLKPVTGLSSPKWVAHSYPFAGFSVSGERAGWVAPTSSLLVHPS